MKKRSLVCFLGTVLMLILSGCGVTDDKTANLSVVYAVTALISVAVLACYFFLSKKKDPWYLMLFLSVSVVNIGYLWLSVSSNLDTALMANRLAYLGSVFLPLSMFMIVLSTVRIKLKRWSVASLLVISGIMFLIAASPGYLDIYYKEVYLETIDGFSTLNKVYGPLHSLYLVYLVGYFAAMIYAIAYAFRRKSAKNIVYTVVLAMAVFVNIGIWFIEQLVHIDFELLSVSYIISELFLLGLSILMTEHEKQKEQSDITEPLQTAATTPQIDDQMLLIYKEGFEKLTKTEKIIYDAYIDGKSTKDIMKALNITENTLKFHNKNIYSKLGVSSRKQLVEISKAL